MEKSYFSVKQFIVANTVIVWVLNIAIGFFGYLLVSVLFTSAEADTPRWMQYVSFGLSLVVMLLIIGINIWCIRQARSDELPKTAVGAMIAYTGVIPLFFLFLGSLSPILFVLFALPTLFA